MFEVEPDFARCECGGQIVFKLWGDGIDSEVYCRDCDEIEHIR